MIPLAVQPGPVFVAAFWPLFRCATDHCAPVLARLVWSGAVTAPRLMVATLALDVAPSPVELADAVEARIGLWFDMLSYACNHYTFVQ